MRGACVSAAGRRRAEQVGGLRTWAGGLGRQGAMQARGIPEYTGESQ